MQTVEKKPVFTERKVSDLGTGLDESEYLDINGSFPFLKEVLFTKVSTNLLKKYGYFKDGSIRLSCFVDLLNQAKEINEKCKKYLGQIEPYFLDEITIPDDKKGMILIVLNIDEKMTIKLPMEV